MNTVNLAFKNDLKMKKLFLIVIILCLQATCFVEFLSETVIRNCVINLKRALIKILLIALIHASNHNFAAFISTWVSNFKGSLK